MKTARSLDEVLADIDRICPPESPEKAAERRERVRRQQDRARVLQTDVKRS